MIKNRKNKIILGVLAGAAVISLASVGFAQWQIGLVKNEENKNIDVAVDTYAEETCYINVTTAENPKISLGEVAASKKGNGVGYEISETSKGNLEIAITDFTLAISESNKGKTPSLTFKLAVEAEPSGKSLTTTIASGDIFGRNGVTSNFIGLEQNITLENFDNPKCFTIDKSVEGYNIYKLNDTYKKFKFNWGSVFGNVDGNNGIITSGTYTPVSFYQEKINGATGNTEEEVLKNKLTMLHQVQKDLTAMHTSLDKAKLRLTINFGFSE